MEKSQARGTAGWCSRNCGLCVCETDRQTETQRDHRQTQRGREGKRQGNTESLEVRPERKTGGSDLGGLHPPSQGTQVSPLGSEEITQRVKRCVLESEF